MKMKTNLSIAGVGTTLLRNARAFIAFSLILLGIFLRSDALAQCPIGSPAWQYVSTNLSRCGDPGFDPNSTTYYSRLTTEYLTVFNPEAGISGEIHQKYQSDWPTTFLDRVDIGTCGNTVTTLTNYTSTPTPMGDSWTCSWTRTTNFSPSVFYDEYNFVTGGASCSGTLRDITSRIYSGDFNREQMAAEAELQARTHSWIPILSASGSAKKLWYSEWAYALQGQSAVVQFSRYNIKFDTEPGKKYTVNWRLQVDEYDYAVLTNSYVTGVLTEGNIIGTGQEMATQWREPFQPAIGQMIVTTVIGIEVKTEGGCGSGNCGAQEDSTGDGTDTMGSASFYISLGAGMVDDSAGILRMDETIPSAALATPAALQFAVNTNVVKVVTNVDGSIHLAAPTLLVRIVATNSYAYWIHCSTTNGGVYLTNSPFISHLIINPNGSTNTNTLRHVRFRSGSAVTNEFTCEAATAVTNKWALISGNSLKGERLAKIIDTNTQTRLESYSIFTPATSVQLYRRDRLYWVLPINDFLLSETIDPTGLALMTTNTFDSLGRLQLSLKPDGSWDRYEYDSTGWVVRAVRPFTNQPPTASTNECRVTEYSYATVSGSPDISSSLLGKPRTIWELVRGEIVSKTMLAYSTNYTYTRVASYPGAGWTDSGNENSYTSLDIQSRPTRTDNPDGTYTTYQYTDDASGRLTTTRSYDSSSTELRRVEEQVNTLGRMVSRKEYDVPSTPDILLVQELYSDPDEFFRPTKVTYLDATTSVTVKQDCCNAAYTIDRDGIASTNSYDALKRLISTTRLGITSSNTLDAAGRTLSQVRKGTDASLVSLRAMGYDPANRVIRDTNALGIVTSYAHVVDGSNQRVETTTNADGGTRIETYFRDGQLASVNGTAAFPVRYEYGRETEGSYQHPYAKEIKLDSGGSDTAEWIKTYTDEFGRNYKSIYAGSSTNQSFYNNKGQLWKQRDPDGVVTLYANNARGELEYTCIDSNRNDIIDPGSLDRITQTVNEVAPSHGTNVLRTVTYLWLTNNSSTGTLLSSAERSVDGFKTWQTNAGVVSSSVKTLPSAGSYTVTQTAPDGSYSITLYQNGRPASVTLYDSGSTPIGKSSFGYDAHGRQNTATDARTGTTTYTFNNADQIVSVTTPPPGTGAGAQTTTTYFDAMQRATSIVQPDGATVNNVFSLRGELIRTSGSRTYPVGYSYDAQGRMKTMTNWSTFSSSTGARVSTWYYHAERGWLTNKVYDDGNGTKYSYTAAGRLSTRLWARGTYMTNTYNNYGDLSGVTYNDGATPTVSYTYTRRGQQENVTRGSDSWKLFYTTAGQLLSEAGTAGTLNGLRVTNAFDAFLRRTNVTAANGATLLTTNGYTYDLASRLSTARDGLFLATYSYLANSPLVSQVEFKSNTTVRLTTTKAYDNLNRLLNISSTTNTSTQPVFAYAYSYNDANQRTRVNLADGSFWIYEYDSLGQVKSGKRYWSDWTPVAGQQFEYGFDDIGNRTSTKAGGDQVGAALRAASYTNNTLNQITGRDVPAYLNVIGAATATATNVNVNNVMAYRRGEYYRVELNPINTSAAVWQSVTNRAVQSGTTNSLTGNAFLSKTAEVFGYDLDGNLTNDGRWAYVWDGENRLLSMTSRPSSPAGSSNALRFAYDWQGRRISKTVSNFSGSAWSKVLDEKYLSDGWNQLESLNASNSAVVRAFLWGSDLSGSMQGAGGVGGLLAVNAKGASVTFAVFDGNGNVTALINAADGNTLANYEYGPFGQAIRASGTAAKFNPFRFSTKFQDDETDVLYFGYRYYDPSTGRWPSRDPIAEDGGLNLYGFTSNDPVNTIDPFGRDFVAVGDRWVTFLPGIARHMSIEFYEERCPQSPEGRRFTNRTVPDGARRTGQYELLVQSHTYRHFFWYRPRPNDPPIRTFVWDHVSEVLSSSDATDQIVIYSDFQNARPDAARRWQDIVRAAQAYPYAEHPVGPTLQNWPNSKYRLPWENPGNNSNTFAREMARVTGRNADILGGNHPGALSAGPVPDPGYVPVYSPW
jgi:RHS repeat-associated protein